MQQFLNKATTICSKILRSVDIFVNSRTWWSCYMNVMKTSVKFGLLSLASGTLIFVYIRLLPGLQLSDRECSEVRFTQTSNPKDYDRKGCRFKPLACTFAHEENLQCAVEAENASAVFVPFQLVRNTSEIVGEYDRSDLNDSKNPALFRLYLTQFPYYRPLEPYRSSGKFLSFANYHVESRDRVKCISAAYGVPISLQWKRRTGHYYPTQIAQFGLQHYSQYVEKKTSTDSSENDGDYVVELDQLLHAADDSTFFSSSPENADLSEPCWRFGSDVDGDASCARSTVAKWPTQIQKILQKQFSVFVLSLSCPKNQCAFVLQLEFPEAFALPVHLRYDAATLTDISVAIKSFASNNSAMFVEVKYSISEARTEWLQLVRDVAYDVAKGISLLLESKSDDVLLTRILVRNAVNRYRRRERHSRSLKKHKLSWKSFVNLRRFYITSVELCGTGRIAKQLKFYDADDAEPHRLNFFKAADWLLQHQYGDGSWRVNATHYIAGNSNKSAARLTLQPGWCSAMAQGHAVSVLSRAYLMMTAANAASASEKALLYKQAALKAVRVFARPIQETAGSTLCGVASKFPGNITWFEEYPTTPPIFVLNGFLYALFGLFDAASVFADKDAKQLWSAGMQSLARLLPLYDTGSGSLYDLRHFSLEFGGVPPNRARWDYHVTHITQLLSLSTVAQSFDNARDISNLLDTVAERWIIYTSGYRVPHN